MSESKSPSTVDIDVAKSVTVKVEILDAATIEEVTSDVHTIENGIVKDEAIEEVTSDVHTIENGIVKDEAIEEVTSDVHTIENGIVKDEAIESKYPNADIFAEEIAGADTGAIQSGTFDSETSEPETVKTDTVETKIFEPETFEEDISDTSILHNTVEVESLKSCTFESETVENGTVGAKTSISPNPNSQLEGHPDFRKSKAVTQNPIQIQILDRPEQDSRDADWERNLEISHESRDVSDMHKRFDTRPYKIDRINMQRNDRRTNLIYPTRINSADGNYGNRNWMNPRDNSRWLDYYAAQRYSMRSQTQSIPTTMPLSASSWVRDNFMAWDQGFGGNHTVHSMEIRQPQHCPALNSSPRFPTTGDSFGWNGVPGSAFMVGPQLPSPTHFQFRTDLNQPFRHQILSPQVHTTPMEYRPHNIISDHHSPFCHSLMQQPQLMFGNRQQFPQMASTAPQTSYFQNRPPTFTPYPLSREHFQNRMPSEQYSSREFHPPQSSPTRPLQFRSMSDRWLGDPLCSARPQRGQLENTSFLSTVEQFRDHPRSIQCTNDRFY